jgi:uncharacterized protein Usg
MLASARQTIRCRRETVIWIASARNGELQMISESCRRQLAGFGLTTAHILYRRPGYPWLLQSYVWQEYDTWPDFPILQDFLAFWRKSLDGALHSVVVAHSALNRPAEIRSVDGMLGLH